MSNIIIYSGGTFSPVRNHLSLSAIAFGTTGKYLKQQLAHADLRLTRMASDTSNLVTNEDVKRDLDKYLNDPYTKIIIMNAALCDFEGTIGNITSGDHAQRLESCEGDILMTLSSKEKLIPYIKDKRPDIVIVGFKTTTNAGIPTMVEKSERMNVDVVLANDTVTRTNLIYARKGRLVPTSSVTTGDRDSLLKMISKYCQDIQGKISKETKEYLVVDLKAKKYLTKELAFDLALEYSKRNQEDFCFAKSEWCSKEEGVFILRKL